MVSRQQASTPDLPSPATPTGRCPGLTSAEARQPWQTQQPEQDGGLMEPATPPPPSSSGGGSSSESSPLILNTRRLAARPRAAVLVFEDDSSEEERRGRRYPYEVADGSGPFRAASFQQQEILLMLGQCSC